MRQYFLIAAIIYVLLAASQTRLRRISPAHSNIVRRVEALWCLCLGAIAAVASVLWIVRPGTLPSDPSIPIWGRVGLMILFVLVAVLGVTGLRAPTYRPDLGDAKVKNTDSWKGELARRAGRSWWTGEPRSQPNQASARHDV